MDGTKITLTATGLLALAGVLRRRGSRSEHHSDWPNWTAQHAAQAGAYHEDDNEPIDVRASELEWRYEPSYPVDNLVHLMPGREIWDWEYWLREEDEDRTKTFAFPNTPPGWTWRKSFTKWWLSDPTVEPIVVVENVDGKVEGIWDGWHRTGVSVTEGQKTIPAFVGQRRR